MTRRVAVVITTVAAALVLGTGAASANERPFSASLAGNATLSPTSDPCVFQNNETASGTGTHVGRFTWSSEEFANFCVNPNGVAVIGSFMMTAANGDLLFGVYTTLGEFDAAGNLIIHGTYELDGGTGQFADATGSGDVDAIGFLTPGLPVYGSLAGTIDF
jgi:hypothetical protein